MPKNVKKCKIYVFLLKTNIKVWHSFYIHFSIVFKNIDVRSVALVMGYYRLLGQKKTKWGGTERPPPTSQPV